LAKLSAGSISIKENTSVYDTSDYEIIVGYSPDAVEEYMESREYTRAEKEKVPLAFESFIKTLALDAIRLMPDKTFSGKYYYSYYKYHSLKMEFTSESMYLWRNYDHPPTGASAYPYELVTPGDFRWSLPDAKYIRIP